MKTEDEKKSEMEGAKYYKMVADGVAKFSYSNLRRTFELKQITD